MYNSMLGTKTRTRTIINNFLELELELELIKKELLPDGVSIFLILM
jgi:hypothetical protein